MTGGCTSLLCGCHGSCPTATLVLVSPHTVHIVSRTLHSAPGPVQCPPRYFVPGDLHWQLGVPTNLLRSRDWSGETGKVQEGEKKKKKKETAQCCPSRVLGGFLLVACGRPGSSVAHWRGVPSTQPVTLLLSCLACYSPLLPCLLPAGDRPAVPPVASSHAPRFSYMIPSHPDAPTPLVLPLLFILQPLFLLPLYSSSRRIESRRIHTRQYLVTNLSSFVDLEFRPFSSELRLLVLLAFCCCWNAFFAVCIFDSVFADARLPQTTPTLFEFTSV